MQTFAYTATGLLSEPVTRPTWEGLSNVFKAALITLAAVFVPMITAFFAARALGLSALCYEDLSRQALTTGLAVLPFSIYCVVLATRASFKAVLSVGALVAVILGVLTAALV